MITVIKEQLKDKIKEIGFNYDKDDLWQKEMISIEDRYYGKLYGYFDCIYYSSDESEGSLSFNVGFLRNDIFLEFVDTGADDIHIILN